MKRKVDVAIAGAGVAGLWVANVLAKQGLSVAVCDPNPVGGAQTIASQGIVHGGLKYALRPGRQASALRAMPARWRACLAGQGEIDLRGVPLLCEHMHLFAPAASSALRAFFASQLVAGGGRRVDADRAPIFERGLLAQLEDFVIDVPALVRRLAEPLAARIVPEALPSANVEANAFVFAAGAGNAALAADAGFGADAMRRRPLRQVVARLREPAKLFAHCLAGGLGVEPELTATSHGAALYLGGGIARVDADGDRHARARRLLARMFPSRDLRDAAFETCAIDRAEPAHGDPMDAFAERRGNRVLCWPVKLSLAPRLGELVAALLDGLRPRRDAWSGDPQAPSRFARAPWQRRRC